MAITIPIAYRAPHQRQVTSLDGRRYGFAFDWNQRIGRWFFDLETEDGASLMRCKGLALRSDLLRQIRYNPAAPQGFLTLLDSEDRNEEATLDSLGRRHVLVYASAV